MPRTCTLTVLFLLELPRLVQGYADAAAHRGADVGAATVDAGARVEESSSTEFDAVLAVPDETDGVHQTFAPSPRQVLKKAINAVRFINTVKDGCRIIDKDCKKITHAIATRGYPYTMDCDVYDSDPELKQDCIRSNCFESRGSWSARHSVANGGMGYVWKAFGKSQRVCVMIKLNTKWRTQQQRLRDMSANQLLFPAGESTTLAHVAKFYEPIDVDASIGPLLVFEDAGAPLTSIAKREAEFLVEDWLEFVHTEGLVLQMIQGIAELNEKRISMADLQPDHIWIKPNSMFFIIPS